MLKTLLSYEELMTRHTNDFSSLFNSVSLAINNSEAPNLPIYKRLMNYTDSLPDFNGAAKVRSGEKFITLNVKKGELTKVTPELFR